MAVSAPPGFASHLPFTHVAEASTRKNGASNAASRRLKKTTRMVTENVVFRPLRGGCEQPFRVVEGLKGSVNHLVEG